MSLKCERCGREETENCVVYENTPEPYQEEMLCENPDKVTICEFCYELSVGDA